MSLSSRLEFLAEMRMQYQYARSRADKSTIIDRLCDVCHYNRKYAIRLLNAKGPPKPKRKFAKRGRKPIYDHPFILDVLTDIWVASNLPCAKRLKAIIPIWLPHYDKFMVPKEIKDKLLNISASTIDRLMSAYRSKYAKKGLTTTKPGSILKKHIPVKTQQWDETIPGFLETDSVAHCGTTTAGTYVNTVNCVDIATGWTEQRAVWGKGEHGTLEAIKDIEKTLPFPIKGFDCDNGSEFLNWHLLRYLTDRKQPVTFTRARAYHKNDNAHIENKNWTHVRQLIGYQRFEHQKLTQKLNDIYTSEWSLYFNFFIPSVKLISKTRVGAKIIKTHDEPKTPLQRLLEADTVSSQTKDKLSRLAEDLNPFLLQKRMKNKIKNFIKNVKKYEKQNNQTETNKT